MHPLQFLIAIKKVAIIIYPHTEHPLPMTVRHYLVMDHRFLLVDIKIDASPYL
jgi:hypothetical protein